MGEGAEPDDGANPFVLVHLHLTSKKARAFWEVGRHQHVAEMGWEGPRPHWRR